MGRYNSDDYAPPRMLDAADVTDAMVTVEAVKMAFKDAQDLAQWTPERRAELYRRRRVDNTERETAGVWPSTWGHVDPARRFQQNYYAAATWFLALNDEADLIAPDKKNAPRAVDSRGAQVNDNENPESTAEQPGSTS